jgi:hypothetical protein
MKKLNLEDEINLTYFDDEQQAYAMKCIEAHYNKKRRVENIKYRLKCFLKCVVYSPLAIFCRIIAIVSKLAGTLSAICMPYGLYCIYKLILEIKSGVAFSQSENLFEIAAFVIFPFIAFGLYYLFDKASFYFESNK